MPEYLSEGDFLTDKYQIEKILHTDEEGAIYRCKYRRSMVILKQIFPNSSVSSKEKEKLDDAFTKRCDNIKKLQHNSITVIEDYFIHEDNSYYVVLELIPGKTLEELYQEEYNKNFPLDLLLKYMSSICESIIYFNKQKVPLVHGNLCPSSIMVGISGDIKLINFGFKNISLTGKNKGSFVYSSPEQINNKNFDFKTDVFAIGAIMYYFLSGENFRINDNNIKLSQCKPPVSKNIDELVMSCLSQDPSKRPDLHNLTRQLSKLYLSESVRKATRPSLPLPLPQHKKTEEKQEKPSIAKISAPVKEVKKVEEKQEKPSIAKISAPVKEVKKMEEKQEKPSIPEIPAREANIPPAILLRLKKTEEKQEKPPVDSLTALPEEVKKENLSDVSLSVLPEEVKKENLSDENLFDMEPVGGFTFETDDESDDKSKDKKKKKKKSTPSGEIELKKKKKKKRKTSDISSDDTSSDYPSGELSDYEDDDEFILDETDDYYNDMEDINLDHIESFSIPDDTFDGISPQMDIQGNEVFHEEIKIQEESIIPEDIYAVKTNILEDISATKTNVLEDIYAVKTNILEDISATKTNVLENEFAEIQKTSVIPETELTRSEEVQQEKTSEEKLIKEKSPEEAKLPPQKATQKIPPELILQKSISAKEENISSSEGSPDKQIHIFTAHEFNIKNDNKKSVSIDEPPPVSTEKPDGSGKKGYLLPFIAGGIILIILIIVGVIFFIPKH